MSSPLELATRTLIYENRATIANVLAYIGELQQLDKVSEKRAKRWGCAALSAIPLAIFGVFIGAITSGRDVPVFMFGIWGVAAVLLIVGLILWLSNRRYNLEDRRYLLTGKVLELLAKDSAADALVDVKMDLRKPGHASKFTRQGKVRDWKVKYFEDTWLQLRGRLLDGTSYQLIVLEKFQARSKWTRSRSGKSKHKSKTKSATDVALRLKPKTNKYAQLTTLSHDAAAAVQLPPWVTLKALQVSDGTLLLKAGTKLPWDIPSEKMKLQGQGNGVDMIAMMFVSLYQVLNLSRIITKASS